MDRVAVRPIHDRAELFKETAARVGIHEVIAEKDFWVCWILKQLFTIPELDGWLTFKGGTSLFKCFGLIHRFSENVDLAVDFERLGFVDESDPRRADLSYTKRQPLLDAMLQACRSYVAGPFLTALRDRIAAVLGDSGWVLAASDSDPNTVEFDYPRATNDALAYIRPKVILELGTHAEPIPQDVFAVRPFAADQFPDWFDKPDCTVTTVLPHRTFWEKATILHAEYHRPLTNNQTAAAGVLASLRRYGRDGRHPSRGRRSGRPRPSAQGLPSQRPLLPLRMGAIPRRGARRVPPDAPPRTAQRPSPRLPGHAGDVLHRSAAV